MDIEVFETELGDWRWRVWEDGHIIEVSDNGWIDSDHATTDAKSTHKTAKVRLAELPDPETEPALTNEEALAETEAALSKVNSQETEAG